MHLYNIAAPLLYFSGVAVFLLSVFWRPVIGIYFLVPLLPLQPLRYKVHDFFLGKSFVDVILLGVVLGLLLRREKILQRTPFTLVFAVFTVFTYASLWTGSIFASFQAPLWFDDLRLSDWKNNVVVPFVVFYLVLATIKDTKQMKILVLLMCVSMLLMNRAVYKTMGQHDQTSFSYNVRAQSGQLAANGLAALEVQFAAFVWSLRVLSKRWLLRLAYLALAATCIYCTMVSFSRGGYLAFLVTWLFLGILVERKLLVALVLFLVSWQAIVPPAVRERVLMTYNSDTGLENSAAERTVLWEDALGAFKRDPIFGLGYNTYSYLHRVGTFRDTHNIYLKILFETGIVGLCLFLWMVWRIYTYGYRLFRSCADPFLASLGLGLAAWMACTVVTNIFGDRWNYIQLTGYLFAILGCVTRGYMIMQQQEMTAAAEQPDLAATDSLSVATT